MQGIAEYLAAVAKDARFTDDETLREIAERLAFSPADAETWLLSQLERDEVSAEQWCVLLAAYTAAIDLQAAQIAWPLADLQSLRSHPYCGVGAKVGSVRFPRMIRSHLPSGVWVSYRVPAVRDWARRYRFTTDTYATHWRYSEPVRDARELRRVSKDGPVLFEIDAHDRELGVAHRDAQRLVEKLLQLGVKSNRLHISFSGNGFHVLADVQLPSSPELPRQAKKFALALARDVGITIDERCYDDARLLRLLGSRHRATGRYKVPLTLDELALPTERLVEHSENAGRLFDRSVA